jgi:hypothetical protein
MMTGGWRVAVQPARGRAEYQIVLRLSFQLCQLRNQTEVDTHSGVPLANHAALGYVEAAHLIDGCCPGALGRPGSGKMPS